MDTNKRSKHEVRYTLPDDIMHRFTIAAQIAGKSVNEFIRLYTLRCTMVDLKISDPARATTKKEVA